MTVLAQKARLSVAWTTGLNVLRDATQFGLMLVLVRLLPVEAYGQFGLINTIIGFMMVFSSREFIAHTLLVRDDREVNYQEQFTAGCFIQGTLFIAANIAAVVLRYFPTYAPVAPLLHVMSISFLLDLPSELRTKMLERSLDWRRLRTIEACGIVGSAALTLGLALAGANVYALLIPAFTIPAAFAFDLFVIARWRPTFGWHAGRYQRVARLRRQARAQRQLRERIESSREQRPRQGGRLRDARHLRPRVRHGHVVLPADRVTVDVRALPGARPHSAAQ